MLYFQPMIFHMELQVFKNSPELILNATSCALFTSCYGSHILCCCYKPEVASQDRISHSVVTPVMSQTACIPEDPNTHGPGPCLRYSHLHLRHHLFHHFPRTSESLLAFSHHCSLQPTKTKGEQFLTKDKARSFWMFRKRILLPRKRYEKIHLHPYESRKSSQPLGSCDCCEEKIART